MTAAWLTGPFLSLDLETTSPDPETARIVTAHAVECSAAGANVIGSWLVNPGIPIPAEASAIHGITDEIAATGQPPDLAVSAISNTMAMAWMEGRPVVIMNAGYDLGVVRAERARIGLPALTVGPLLDPHIIDRGCDPYRAGKRKLLDLARQYRVKTGEAHSAKDDALMAARIVWAMANGELCSEIAHLSLEEMQTWQRATHAKWALQYRSWLRSGGKPADVDAEWPLRTQTQREAA